jgi:hypothetical protein
MVCTSQETTIEEEAHTSRLQSIQLCTVDAWFIVAIMMLNLC